MMSLHETARLLGADMPAIDVRFSGVSTDSRSIRRGDLFVALRGERFDGHAFLDAARAAGAAGALVDRAYAVGASAPLPAIAVADTRTALGEFARQWRDRFALPLIAVTGSNGKTTTKEMLAAILRTHVGADAVLATEGNLNNDIGVPLTLLRLSKRHRYAAIELGMNHKGEIAALARIARPGIALVNNAQREHLEFLGSVEEVAAENASVYAALATEGIAIVNADDANAPLFRRTAQGRRVLEFGLARGTAVTCRYALKALSSDLELQLPSGSARASLAIPGLHNVCNALAAAACASAAGVPSAAIGAGLSGFRPYAGRLQVKHAAAGAVIIDDSYNANPDSVRAAIDVLAGSAGQTLLVLGDMGEVGEQGPDFHAEIGRYARERGIGTLYAVGELTAHATAGFGSGARHFASHEELLRAAQAHSGSGTTVLVKGSRFMRMERVVAGLTGAVKPAPAAPGAH